MTRTSWSASVAVLALSSSIASARPDDDQSGWLQYPNPHDAGWSEAALDEAFHIARDAGSAAVMVVVEGHVLVAWGDVERRLNAHSIRKSMLSATFGIHAVLNETDQGAIDLEATLEELDIDDQPPLTAAERQARVIDLLRGRSGVYHPAAYETAGKKRERPARGSYAPGTHFWSNNWDFNTLLTIFEQQTNKKFFEEFERAIAQPIAMQDFRPSDGEYLYESDASIHPAYPLRISTRDLARIGQLVLQRGRWNGQHVIPQKWIDLSTRAHTVFGEGGGYTGNFRAGAGFGFMWWVYPAGCHPDGYPALDQLDAIAAQGSGGHLMLVIPQISVVFVHRAATDDGRRVAWDQAWRIAETVVAGREGPPASEPTLVPLTSLELGPGPDAP